MMDVWSGWVVVVFCWLVLDCVGRGVGCRGRVWGGWGWGIVSGWLILGV